MRNQEVKSLLHIFGLARIHFSRLSCQMLCQACWGWLLAFTSARSTYYLSPRTDSFIVKRLFSQIGFVCALSICLYKSFCEACTFDSYHYSSMQVLVFSAISPRVPLVVSDFASDCGWKPFSGMVSLLLNDHLGRIQMSGFVFVIRWFACSLPGVVRLSNLVVKVKKSEEKQA